MVAGRESVLNLLQRCRSALVLVITPLVLSPLLISSKKEWRCAFCVCVMAVYWMTEVLPLAVTAMLPVILFPLTGVMTSHDVAQQFINDTIFLLIGGQIMAVAVEKCHLHKRVALSVLKMVGSEPKWIMLGFMIITALLSMFISNSATTAMMVPIAKSVVNQLIESYNSHPQNRVPNAEVCKRVSTALVLCICTASHIGGTGTLTGTSTNLVMVGQLRELFGDGETSMNYFTWLLFAFPLLCICLAAAWCILTVFFLRNAPGKDAHITELMHRAYDDLPRTSYAEKSMMFCFVALLSLWILRKPGFFKGFGEYLPKDSYTDSTSAMIVAVLLFALPSEKPDLFTCKTKEEIKKKSRLMEWSTMQKSFPWSFIILLGGGFALAAGLCATENFLQIWNFYRPEKKPVLSVKASGLSATFGRTLACFGHLPLWILQLLTVAIAMGTTNICSNSVAATIIVPIVATLATEIGRHPFTLILPATLACSFAFVLPVGAPTNTIVFGTGMIKFRDMVNVGIVTSLMCLTLTVLYMNTVAPFLLSLSEFPEWAQPRNSSAVV